MERRPYRAIVTGELLHCLAHASLSESARLDIVAELEHRAAERVAWINEANRRRETRQQTTDRLGAWPA